MEPLYRQTQEVGQAVETAEGRSPKLYAQDEVEDPTKNKDTDAPTAIRATTLRTPMIGAVSTLGA